MEDKLKHLELINDVIGRLSQHSFSLRGWAVTLVAAILALSAREVTQFYFLIALIPTLTFWGLDAYYLRQERLFRRLYDRVRSLDPSELESNPFSMDTLPFTYPQFAETMADAATIPPPWWKTCFSVTIGWLYGSLVFTIMVVTVIALLWR